MKKDKDALIVVDAWKEVLPVDIKLHPFLEKETKTFGTWLNHMFSQIRQSPSAPDIIHCGDGHNLMDEIDTSQDIICPFIKDIKDEYNNYYFCGFHMNICIPRKIIELEQKIPLKGAHGIVINLSMIYPGCSFLHDMSIQNLLGKAKPLYMQNMFYYTHVSGFEKIYIYK